jgi:anti-sigma regulatory factor (Ser/Thr protein kinase)
VVCASAGARTDDILLGLTEAVANVVQHACSSQAQGELLIRGHLEGDVLEISIREAAASITPQPAADSTSAWPL